MHAPLRPSPSLAALLLLASACQFTLPEHKCPEGDCSTGTFGGNQTTTPPDDTGCDGQTSTTPCDTSEADTAVDTGL